jgi:hypothetical protein
MRSLVILVFVLAGAAVSARAGEAPAEPKADPMARICDAFGPGYQLVPGTTTCVKIGGYVRSGVTFSDKPGSGDFVPGAGADSQTAKPR